MAQELEPTECWRFVNKTSEANGGQNTGAWAEPGIYSR